MRKNSKECFFPHKTSVNSIENYFYRVMTDSLVIIRSGVFALNCNHISINPNFIPNFWQLIAILTKTYAHYSVMVPYVKEDVDMVPYVPKESTFFKISEFVKKLEELIEHLTNRRGVRESGDGGNRLLEDNM